MNKMIGIAHESLVFARRTRALASAIGELLPSRADILDVGCGDGTVDRLILQSRPDLEIRGIDVLQRPSSAIPVSTFDGVTFPCADKSVDTVLFVDVLHHTNDPCVLLREAVRVARQSIVIKDHTMNGPFAYSTLRIMDWFGNAHHGVALPYNYWPEARWRSSFAELGLSPAAWHTRLGLYPFPASLIFERHLHFVAELRVP